MTEDLGYGPSTVGTASYGAAGQVTNLYYYGYSETRTYNNLLQLTRMTVPGTMDMEYRYSPTQNNGRITQSKDWITGEEVTYTYDALQRLVRAETTDYSWGDAYSYDGFGNLIQKAVTKGNAPPFTGYYDPAHPGGGDPNGLAAMSIPGASAYPYDVENHLLRVPDGAYGAWAGYGPWGKRVTKRTVTTVQPQYDGTWEIYFYGITGQRLATFGCEYQFDGNGNATQFTCDSEKTNIYFGGKLVKSDGVTVVTDRLGSVRANSSGERFSYFPWGEERTPVTADGRQKFGTYLRDPGGLDYADQRYYSNIPGRFMTPDPIGIKAVVLEDPDSWNRYSYSRGDPVNSNDPSGLTDVVIGGVTQSSSHNDIDEFASSIGAITVFPYAGGTILGGVISIAGLSLDAYLQAAAVGLAIIDAAKDSTDDINIFAFSGAAAVLANALKLLPDDVKQRINNVTYASPGIIGELPIVNGKAPTIVFGNGLADVAATIMASAPIGTKFIQTDCDGHSASCEFAAAADQAGSRCNVCRAFSADDSTNYLRSFLGMLAYIQGGYGLYYFGDYLLFPETGIEVVTSTVTYQLP